MDLIRSHTINMGRMKTYEVPMESLEHILYEYNTKTCLKTYDYCILSCVFTLIIIVSKCIRYCIWSCNKLHTDRLMTKYISLIVNQEVF